MINTKAIIGKSIFIDAPAIDATPCKNMVTDNCFKVSAHFGDKRKGRRPAATLNLAYTKIDSREAKTLAQNILNRIAQIKQKLNAMYSKEFEYCEQEQSHIEGNKLLGECEPINVAKEKIMQNRSGHDRGQFLTIFGEPSICYIDPHIEYQPGAHYMKL